MHGKTIVIGLLLITALWGCGGPPQQNAPAPKAPDAASPGGILEAASNTAPEAMGEPVDGDWIVSRLLSDMPTLNPILSSHDAMAKTLTDLIYEGLLKRDNATWEMKPNLAESYEESPDHLVYTFHLRTDVKFSDGVPFTAEDIKFTYDVLMAPTTDSLPLRNYFDNVASCEVLDPYTVRFTCKEPYFKTLISLSEDIKALPKHIFSAGEINKHPNNRKPVGTGPFVMETWDTNQRVIMVRNENYWGVKPHVVKRLYKIITDDNAALQSLERGELDIMGMTPDQWVNQAARPEFEARFNKLTYYTPSHGYIGWNMRRPQFADKRVRQAMTMLLNRDLILETIMRGLGVVVTNSFFVDSPEYNKELKPWPFDPEQAKKQLEEAGWVDSNGDGIRDKDGAPFRFEFLVPSGSPETEQLATVYKEDLAKAGVEMNIRLLEWATFVETTHNLKFDAMIMGWQLDPEQDPYQIWHSSQAEQGSNYPGLKNPEVDRIIEEARREFDHAKRSEMYHRMSAIIHDEQPYTFLFCMKARAALDKRFQNVKVYPLGLDGKEWWVPAELQKYK
jgi:peptide/nickel transport system substrate-binding protein